jgi:hypothetical protein
MKHGAAIAIQPALFHEACQVKKTQQGSAEK